MAPDELALWQIVAVGMLVDILIGDPQFRLHPVRLIGDISRGCEWFIRLMRGNGYVGGLLHLLCVCSLTVLIWLAGHSACWAWNYWVGIAWDILSIASLLSLRDLCQHGWRVHRALKNDDIAAARQHLSWFVGRDTDNLDAPAVRRASIETLSESIVDGVIMPVACLALAGIPGLVLAKTISTLDSMVGYRNQRYQRFGMWAARLDDGINYIPARCAPFMLAVLAPLLSLHPITALTSAWRWHALLPSPNSGWIEAAFAGALRVRLLGPIYAQGECVNETYLGEADWTTDPGRTGLRKALIATFCLGLMSYGLCLASIAILGTW